MRSIFNIRRRWPKAIQKMIEPAYAVYKYHLKMLARFIYCASRLRILDATAVAVDGFWPSQHRRKSWSVGIDNRRYLAIKPSSADSITGWRASKDDPLIEYLA